MKLTGAEIVIQCLLEQGADTIFGYPGGAVLYIYDAIYKAGKDIKHVLVRHEQGALHAADGYARVTGKPGVAVVTSGPGATNAVTGLATAYMDSIPLVCISGQVPRALIGNDAFQEADTVGITRSCTKHNYLVSNIEELPRIMREAFYIARSGRPGPVLIDIPKDVTALSHEYVRRNDVTDPAMRMRSYRPTIQGHKGQIRRAVRLLKTAKRPMFYTGGGVVLSGASEELTRLTRLLEVPITNTLMGLGGFPSTDPQFLGMLGMHGTYEANLAISHCDLLFAVGARFDDRVTGRIEEFAKGATIIHIDVDPTSISKNVRVDVPIVGDIKSVLTEILELLEEPAFLNDRADLAPWWQEIQAWRKRDCLSYRQGDTVIEPQYVIQKLYEHTRGQAIVATDVGQHQMWAAQFYGFEKPRRWLTSGGLGTMGYGLPAAMGAQVAAPNETVIAIVGDGSVQMNIQELATLHQYGLPVKVAILNNGYLGMVRQWQEFFYDRRYAESDMGDMPDFVRLAEAYGAMGLRATRPDQVDGVIQQALAHPGAVVMDFRVNREANVYPMVPAGGALSDMILL